jgi:hypothetical protein
MTYLDDFRIPEFLFDPVPHAGVAAFINCKTVVSREVFDHLLLVLKARAVCARDNSIGTPGTNRIVCLLGVANARMRAAA